jgi:RNA polymerase sigma factor (sigma-70 family)
MTTSVSRAACGSLHERSLLRAAQHHDLRAREELLERFRPLLENAVFGFRAPGGLEREDLAQEARVAFLRAVARWRPGRGPFAPFARTCVRNRLLNVIATARAEKHQILTRAIPSGATRPSRSRDQHAVDDPEDGCDPDRLLVGDNSANPEAVVIARDHLQCLRLAMGALTAWERTTLTATLNGSSHHQLALEHGVSVRAVTLAVRRARRKLAQHTARAETC